MTFLSGDKTAFDVLNVVTFLSGDKTAFDVLNVVTFLSGDKTALNDEDDLKDQSRVGSA